MYCRRLLRPSFGWKVIRSVVPSFQLQLTGTSYYRTSSPICYCKDEENEIREPTSKGLTPAMRQYFTMKESVPGYLLLFQMGDFFEIFYEDAVTASKLLDLTLTSRHKGEHASKNIIYITF